MSQSQPLDEVRQRLPAAAADTRRHRGRGWLLVAGISIAVGAALIFGAVSAYQLVVEREAEIAVLVHDLASGANERDALQTAKQQLAAERDQLSLSSNTERARADLAEATARELAARITDAEATIAKLRADLEASQSEVERLNEAVARQRERSEATQADARSSAATAAQLLAAQERTQQVASAALAYAEAARVVAVTRDQMIQLLRDQILAERSGRYAAASGLVDQFNALVPVHNRQVQEALAALDRLRALLP